MITPTKTVCYVQIAGERKFRPITKLGVFFVTSIVNGKKSFINHKVIERVIAREELL